MNTKMSLFLVTVWMLTVGWVLAQTDFNQGGQVDLATTIDGSVRVDWQSPGVATELNLLPEGHIQGYLSAHHNSSVNILGGTVGQHLETSGNSQIYLHDGSIGLDLAAYNDSRIIMDGGTIGWYVRGYNYAHLVWSGGTIGSDIWLYDNAVLTIYGSDFELNGTPVFDTLTGTLGRLTGTLDDGRAIDNEIRLFNNTQIALIPEPATLALLLCGAALIRKTFGSPPPRT